MRRRINLFRRFERAVRLKSLVAATYVAAVPSSSPFAETPDTLPNIDINPDSICNGLVIWLRRARSSLVIPRTGLSTVTTTNKES